jgi:hypothetical protein
MVMLVLGSLLLLVGGVLDSVFRFRMFRLGQRCALLLQVGALTTVATTMCARSTVGQRGQLN